MAERKFGREVTVEELKQMVEGDVPVELPYYKTRSTSLGTKSKRLEPKKAQTLPVDCKALTESSLGGKVQKEKEAAVTNETNAREDSSDSDSEVEKARIAFLEAKIRSAERKKNKSRTIDDTLPHKPQEPGPSHLPRPPIPYPYNPSYWSPISPERPGHQSPVSPFATPTTIGSPSTIPPGSRDSGNVTYNLTTDSYNDSSLSYRHHVTKRARKKD